MTPVLDARPISELTDRRHANDRVSLADLAGLGAEELTEQLCRALPGTGPGPVPVAAFNSSI
ncbi:FxSxx-COOH protein [Kitasatospora sp. NBC_01560]|uniref:FxSxx-COOH cyclophane-containing RiPP peptide n=1 Tax=Kitasatospora sp. NBC_01560 TaxID=2975965 RepID=UPI00386AD54E